MRFRAPLICLCLLYFCADAAAHGQSVAQLSLDLREQSAPQLVAELALADLLYAIELDADRDGRLTWGEVVDSKPSIASLVAGGIQLSSGEVACNWREREASLQFVDRADTPSLRLEFAGSCASLAPRANQNLAYRLFEETNSAHRAILRVITAEGDNVSVLYEGNRSVSIDAGSGSSATVSGFVAEGFRHIVSGYDHLVFVLLLILPAAGRGAVRKRVLEVAGVVTAFTLAHSITLAAAATELVTLPARPVETAIAASIVVAGVANGLWPAHRLGWKVAFAFGLLHGFGFAGALSDFGLDTRSLLAGLLGFNIGIELGQLLVVAVVLPCLFLMARSARYRRWFVPAASLACAAVGVGWTATRM